MEFKIGRSSGQCAATGRELKEGEVLYSVLLETSDGPQRLDYCEEAWSGPPPEAIAFWKGRVPPKDQPRSPVRNPEALLQLFERLDAAAAPGELGVAELAVSSATEPLRYLLALLLVRKRLFKLGDAVPPLPPARGGIEGGEASSSGEVLEFTCIRSGTNYRVGKPDLSAEQMEQIEAQLAELMETAE